MSDPALDPGPARALVPASRRWKKLPLRVAVAGAALTLVAGIAVTLMRRALVTDLGKTRPAVEETVATLAARRPVSIDDEAFIRAAEDASRAQYVAAISLFAPDGRIVWSNWGALASPGTAEKRATDETVRILRSIPADGLGAEERLWVLAASAIQAEGEHNDIHRHMVRSVRADDGRLVGLVGAAYSASPGLASPFLVWAIAVLSIPIGLIAYWIGLPLWVFLDARERGERAWAWALFCVAGNLGGLFAYLLARSPRAQAAAGA